MSSTPKKPPKSAKKAAHRVTSSGGGVAGKLGDRYEARWTILRGVLPVLADEFNAVRVEEPGFDAIEFRLVGGRDSKPDEGHQCKRTHTTTWTVQALRREHFVGPLAAMTDAGTHVVFASEKSSVLGPMADKARRLDDVDRWTADLTDDDEGVALTKLQQEWDVGTEDVHRRLRMTTFEQIGDPTLRQVLLALLNTTVSGDPEAVAGLLRGYIEDHFAEDLTSDKIWKFLRDKGHHPVTGFSAALSERVRDTVTSYVSHAETSRPAALGHVDRSEVGRIVDELHRVDGPPVVVVAGKPGSGKSHVLAEVCKTLSSLGVTTGVLRLDLAQAAHTAAELGAQPAMGFDGSPAQILARASGGNPSVLVVDQADSASMLSGRGHTVSEALRDMLQQARSTAHMKVLLACRSEDLRFDATLRRLVDLDNPASRNVTRIDIGDLTAEQVGAALASLDLDVSRTPAPLLTLTANVLNLSLFVRVYEAADPEDRPALTALRTRLQLLREYHELMSARMLPTLGPNVYTAAALRIAKEMSDRGMLSVSRVFMAAENDTLNSLLHHGVMVDDNGRLRFFHEAMFDYLAAVALQSTGATATNLLSSGPQELLRRGQVRSMLALTREDSASNEYLADLSGVLDGTTSRSHIRAAAMSMLSEMDEVWEQELTLVLRIAADNADPMRQHALGTMTTDPFARRFASSSLLDVAAAVVGGMGLPSTSTDAALLSQVGVEGCGYLLMRSAANEPNAAATAALAAAASSIQVTTWLNGFLRLIHLAGPSASGGALADLFVELARAATSAVHDEEQYRADTNAAAQRLGVDRAVVLNNLAALLFGDGRYALGMIAKHTPAELPRALQAWLEAAASINAARSGSSLFGWDSILGRDATGLGIFNRAAQAAPRSFVESLLPLVTSDWRGTAKDYAWTPTGSDDQATGLRYTRAVLSLSTNSIEHEVTDALTTAATLAVQTEPEEVAGALASLHGSDLLPVHELLSHVYGTATGSVLDNALEWACDPRVRGLPQGTTVGWAWGTVAGRVVSTGTAEQRGRMLACVRVAYGEFTPAGGTGAGSSPALADDTLSALAQEELIVLTRVKTAMGADLPADLDERIAELESAHGPAPSEPSTWAQVIDRHSEREVPSGLSDSEWTTHIERVTAGMKPDVSDRFEENLYNTTTGLAQDTAREPARFARLAMSLPTTTPAPIVSAVLRGIADNVSLLDDTGVNAVLDLIRAMLTREPIAEVDLDLLRLINKLAAVDLPADVLAVPSAVYDRNPPPEPWNSSNLEVAGLNHPRGAAITTAAELLNHSHTRAARLPQLAPLLARAAEAEHAQIRILVPMALSLVHMQDPELAGALIDLWLANARDEELTARYLDRLTWQLAVTRPATAESLLGRMIASTIPDAKRRAGQLATLFDVRGIDVGSAGEQPPLALAMADEAGRRGVAEVIVQLGDDLPSADDVREGAETRADHALLIELANDASDEVRAEIMDIGRYMQRSVADYDALLDPLADTEAFQEHPGRMFHVLSQRLDELPPAALKLCQVWADRFAATANDMANRETAEAPDVTDIVLGVYARALPGSTTRERCLDLIDLFVECRIGNIEKKADDVVYEPSR